MSVPSSVLAARHIGNTKSTQHKQKPAKNEKEKIQNNNNNKKGVHFVCIPFW